MPQINTAYSFDVALVSQADTRLFQVNPTLATGDVKVAIDEGAFANLTALPTVTPASGRNVKVALTAAEMNGSRITVQFADVSGAEWCELLYVIETTPDNLTIAAIKASILADNTSFNGASVATIATGVGTIGTNVVAVKAKTDNLPGGVARNTPFPNFEFVMYDNTDHISGKVGLTVTAQRSIDSGAFGACTNSVTEIGNGVYAINFSAADLNGGVITFRFSGAGADPTTITITTA